MVEYKNNRYIRMIRFREKTSGKNEGGHKATFRRNVSIAISKAHRFRTKKLISFLLFCSR